MGDGLTESKAVGFKAPLVYAGEGVSAHPRCGFGSGEDALDGDCEGGDIAHGVDEALDAVGDEVRVSTCVCRNNDGDCSIHGFIDDEAPGFVPGGEDENGGE